MNDLVASEDVFFADTGITDGELLEGVKYTRPGARTSGPVVRGTSGIERQVTSMHRLASLRKSSTIEYLSIPYPDH